MKIGKEFATGLVIGLVVGIIIGIVISKLFVVY